MNKLLTDIIAERKGHYCHALEVSDVYELECIAEGVIDGYPGYTEEEYIQFFETISVYALNGDNEADIYNFNFDEYIRGTI